MKHIQNHRIMFFTVISLFLTAMSLDSPAQDALDIIKKADAKSRGNYAEQEMRMTIVRPDWTRSVTMKSWSKGTEYALILITAPAKEKGQVFLKREKEMWNWVPSIERTIKIPPSMMMQSWMGSDFTNDDLVKESSMVVDYVHTLIGSENYSGVECWKIQLLPKPDAPVVWGKLVVWIDRNYNQRKVEYYDEDEVLVNTMLLSEIRKMNDREIPTRMEMIPNDEKNKKTVVEVLNAMYNKPIPDSYFSLQNIKVVR
jgi:hypothetical protein